MVDVKQYLKESGGNWLRADNVQVGDKLRILSAGDIDDKTFDRSYLVMPVVLMRTGENFSLRLGPKNVTRIAESFGETDTGGWVNRLLEVISIETYKGLGQKGVLLRGCAPSGEAAKPGKPAPKPEGLSSQTIDTIRGSQDILDMGIPLNESDFSILPAGVRAELLKQGLAEKRVEGDVALYFFVKEKCEKFL